MDCIPVFHCCLVHNHWQLLQCWQSLEIHIVTTRIGGRGLDSRHSPPLESWLNWKPSLLMSSAWSFGCLGARMSRPTTVVERRRGSPCTTTSIVQPPTWRRQRLTKKYFRREILLGSKFVALCDIDYVKWTFFCKSFFLRTNSSSWSLEIEATGAEGWVITMDMSKVQGGQSPVTLENSLTDRAVFKWHLFCWGLFAVGVVASRHLW